MSSIRNSSNRLISDQPGWSPSWISTCSKMCPWSTDLCKCISNRPSRTLYYLSKNYYLCLGWVPRYTRSSLFASFLSLLTQMAVVWLDPDRWTSCAFHCLWSACWPCFLERYTAVNHCFLTIELWTCVVPSDHFWDQMLSVVLNLIKSGAYPSLSICCLSNSLAHVDISYRNLGRCDRRALEWVALSPIFSGTPPSM